MSGRFRTWIGADDGPWRWAIFAIAHATVWTHALLVSVAVSCALIWGGHPVAIESGSMAPALMSGDVVVIDDRSLEPGAIVTYVTDDGKRVTHRVVEVRDGTVVTKGDANGLPDSAPVAIERVEGVARIVVPFIGMPRVWFAGGDYVPFALWLTGVLSATWIAWTWRHMEGTPPASTTSVAPRRDLAENPATSELAA